jgi:diaminopropionate ammonia-lyase
VSEFLVNPGRVPCSEPVPDGSADARRFHQRLPGFAPTRLVNGARLAAELGLAHLWIKDESSRLGLPSYKILGASWATYRMLTARLGGEPRWSHLAELRAALAPLGPLTLVAATDGNHGRAVARVARWLGYTARILLPDSIPAARVEPIRQEGARVDLVRGTYDDAVRASADLATDDVLVVSDTAWPGYVEVPAWVIEGYAAICAEVDEQLGDGGPDLVVVQMGVGALAAAVVRHYAAGARIVMVEPTTAACGLRSAAAGHPVTVPGPHRSIMTGLNCGTVSSIAWPVLAAGVDAFVAVEDEQAERAVRDLAAVGVVAGETGAAGLAGLRSIVELDPPGRPDLSGRSALVLCTEGATDPAGYARIVGGSAPGECGT